MVSGGSVVLKLPARRVVALLASGEAARSTPAKGPRCASGSPADPDPDAGLALGYESLAFVRGVGGRSRRDSPGARRRRAGRLTRAGLRVAPDAWSSSGSCEGPVGQLCLEAEQRLVNADGLVATGEHKSGVVLVLAHGDGQQRPRGGPQRVARAIVSASVQLVLQLGEEPSRRALPGGARTAASAPPPRYAGRDFRCSGSGPGPCLGPSRACRNPAWVSSPSCRGPRTHCRGQDPVIARTCQPSTDAGPAAGAHCCGPGGGSPTRVRGGRWRVTSIPGRK